MGSPSETPLESEYEVLITTKTPRTQRRRRREKSRAPLLGTFKLATVDLAAERELQSSLCVLCSTRAHFLSFRKISCAQYSFGYTGPERS